MLFYKIAYESAAAVEGEAGGVEGEFVSRKKWNCSFRWKGVADEFIASGVGLAAFIESVPAAAILAVIGESR